VSLIKLAIEGGPHSDLPNAFKVRKGMGPKSNIPLAKGMFPKVAEKIILPMSHLKGDHNELEKIKSNAQGLTDTTLGRRVSTILKIVKEMEADDKQAKKDHKVIK